MDGDERLSHIKWTQIAGTAGCSGSAVGEAWAFHRVEGTPDWSTRVSRFERLQN